jgi:hypothetical protein
MLSLGSKYSLQHSFLKQPIYTCNFPREENQVSKANKTAGDIAVLYFSVPQIREREEKNYYEANGSMYFIP